MTAVRAQRSIRLAFALLVLLVLLLAGALAHAAAPALDLKVELDPERRHFKALAEVVPASADFHFVLHESLEVTSATAGGKRVKVDAAGREGALRGWRVVLPSGASSVRLAYGGTLPALDPGLDHRGVLRELPPMAAREGSFLPAGSAWYPQPASLFTYRVALSVPSSQRALVPGRLVSEALPSNEAHAYRARFEFTQPTDGIDLMAGPWVVREKTMPVANGTPPGATLRLRTYFTRELDATPGLADGYLEDTRRYLERYAAQIGAYPFAGFSVVSGPLPTGFGMPTLTYLGADVIRLPFIRATSLGHEVLHNWWGNGVYVDYEQGNWSEGLTTFMADYAYKEQQSPEAAREMRQGWLRDFAAVAPGDQAALRAFRSRTHGAAAAVGYGKAAMVFVMLRDTIGEEAFNKGIRAFWKNKRFSRANWNDLRLAFEQASGRPLRDFFSQWIDRAGGPVVAIAAANMAAAISTTGPQRLALALEQSQPSYVLRVPVELVYADHAEIRWIDMARQRELVSLDVKTAPAGVRVDPDLRLWRVLERDQLPPILRQWFLARAPRIVLASEQDEVREAAGVLARRLFESPPVTASQDDIGTGTTPVLLVGLHADVDAALARAGMPARPASVAGKGSAQVWTVARETGPPLAVVSADDADALRALQRPLPHYGAQSWIVFDGSRALARGVWPAPGRLVKVGSSR